MSASQRRQFRHQEFGYEIHGVWAVPDGLEPNLVYLPIFYLDQEEQTWLCKLTMEKTNSFIIMKNSGNESDKRYVRHGTVGSGFEVGVDM